MQALGAADYEVIWDDQPRPNTGSVDRFELRMNVLPAGKVGLSDTRRYIDVPGTPVVAFGAGVWGAGVWGGSLGSFPVRDMVALRTNGVRRWTWTLVAESLDTSDGTTGGGILEYVRTALIEWDTARPLLKAVGVSITADSGIIRIPGTTRDQRDTSTASLDLFCLVADRTPGFENADTKNPIDWIESVEIREA